MVQQDQQLQRAQENPRTQMGQAGREVHPQARENQPDRQDQEGQAVLPRDQSDQLDQKDPSRRSYQLFQAAQASLHQ